MRQGRRKGTTTGDEREGGETAKRREVSVGRGVKETGRERGKREEQTRGHGGIVSVSSAANLRAFLVVRATILEITSFGYLVR